MFRTILNTPRLEFIYGAKTSFFAAPFGVAAMLEPSQQAWLNDLYDVVRKREEDYYEDTVTLLCMFVMTRNYWSPALAR